METAEAREIDRVVDEPINTSASTSSFPTATAFDITDPAPPSSSSSSSSSNTSESPTQTGYLDDPTPTPRGLGPSSLLSHLAQHSAAHSRTQYEQGWSSIPYPPSPPHSHSQSQSQSQSQWQSRLRTRSHQTPRSARSGRPDDDQNNTNDNDNAHWDQDSCTSSQDSHDEQDSIDRELEQEWKEQLDQLKLLVHIIVFPFLGKFFGRKYAYFRKS
ncbi:hypothetical protein BCV70DRAFT_197095 [Testicularia cyperi]|uniref:Uncharacterized protein n=1 Tax=Testicularia cyperi TaxID=1882483 RepID=A0A317XY48_9BASI|nr:hypothetical protein BCV70DRAFT_197095 [Testicularia cyperi]